MTARPTPTADRLADDMAEHGDSVKAAAARLRLDYGNAKKIWRRICASLGEPVE